MLDTEIALFPTLVQFAKDTKSDKIDLSDSTLIEADSIPHRLNMLSSVSCLTGHIAQEDDYLYLFNGNLQRFDQKNGQSYLYAESFWLFRVELDACDIIQSRINQSRVHLEIDPGMSSTLPNLIHGSGAWWRYKNSAMDTLHNGTPFSHAAISIKSVQAFWVKHAFDIGRIGTTDIDSIRRAFKPAHRISGYRIDRYQSRYRDGVYEDRTCEEIIYDIPMADIGIQLDRFSYPRDRYDIGVGRENEYCMKVDIGSGYKKKNQLREFFEHAKLDPFGPKLFTDPQDEIVFNTDFA